MRISGIFAMSGGYDDRYDDEGFFYFYGGSHRAGFPDKRNGFREPGRRDPRFDQPGNFERWHY